MTYFNDRKGAYTDSGKKRLTDGLCCELAMKMKGKKAAYWVFGKMRD